MIPSTVLAAPMGKALDDKVAKLNGDLDNYATEVSDCNAAMTPGNYVCNATTANAPNGYSYGILKVSLGGNGTWAYQSFRPAVQGGNPYEYARSNINRGGWSAWVDCDISKHFPADDFVVLHRAGNLGKSMVLKNSSSVGDYGTIVRDYLADGSRTEIVINSAGVTANKIDANESLISRKQIVTF